MFSFLLSLLQLFPSMFTRQAHKEGSYYIVLCRSSETRIIISFEDTEAVAAEPDFWIFTRLFFPMMGTFPDKRPGFTVSTCCPRLNTFPVSPTKTHVSHCLDGRLGLVTCLLRSLSEHSVPDRTRPTTSSQGATPNSRLTRKYSGYLQPVPLGH